MKSIRSILFQVLALCAAAPTFHCSATVEATDAAPADATTTPDAVADIPDGARDAVPDALPDADTCDAPEITRTTCVSTTVRFGCGLPPGYRPGVYTYPDCGDLCFPYVTSHASSVFMCEVTAAASGLPATLTCRDSCPVDGRRPEGFAMPPPPDGATSLQAWFAASAALECAAIAAFERLAAELEHHGAPASLIARASESADDERRHTRMMCALARRHGVEVAPLEPPVGATRALDAIAAENAVEGCVRETYAALLAWWQAGHASDPEVARVYRAIADDESRHAQLAWDVAAWIEVRLDAPSRARVSRERDDAVTALVREMGAAVPDELRGRAGVPAASDATVLLAGLDRRLWSAEA